MSALNDSALAAPPVDLPQDQPRAEMPFIIFCSFLCTFIMARIVVAGLYGGWWKVGGFLFVGGTHVHHLNYGIFLLAIAGFLSLTNLGHGKRWGTAVLYGIGLGLTFDEFGMWLKLEDNYYNRLSYTAVVSIAALFLTIISFDAFRDRAAKRRSSEQSLIPAGTVLFREGETGAEAYYLLDGRVRVSRETSAGPKVLAELGPGEFVGEMALFTSQPRAATAEALEPLRVRRLDRNNLLTTLDHHAELGIRLIRSLAGRLVATNDQLVAALGGNSGAGRPDNVDSSRR